MIYGGKYVVGVDLRSVSLCWCHKHIRDETDIKNTEKQNKNAEKQLCCEILLQFKITVL